eukprot:gene16825-19989_t
MYSEPYRGPLTTEDEDEIRMLGYPSYSMMLLLSIIEDFHLYLTSSKGSAANTIEDVKLAADSFLELLGSTCRRWGAGLDNGADLVTALSEASDFIAAYKLSKPPEDATADDLPEEIRKAIEDVVNAFYTAQDQMCAMMKRATRARCPFAGDQGVWQHLSNPKLQTLYPWLTQAIIGELHIQINNEMMATTSRSPMWEALIASAGQLGYTHNVVLGRVISKNSAQLTRRARYLKLNSARRLLRHRIPVEQGKRLQCLLVEPWRIVCMHQSVEPLSLHHLLQQRKQLLCLPRAVRV